MKRLQNLVAFAFLPLAMGGPALGTSALRADSTTWWPDDTAGMYSYLATPEGKDAYVALPPSIKRELWLVHLRRALGEVPNLSAAQRGLIFETIGLIALGVFEGEPTSDSWDQLYGAQMRDLERRAREAFDARLARSLFAELGPEVDFAVTESFFDPCSCSTESDWCDLITNPNPRCRSGGDYRCRPRASGCGFLLMYACDGLCAE